MDHTDSNNTADEGLFRVLPLHLRLEKAEIDYEQAPEILFPQLFKTNMDPKLAERGRQAIIAALRAGDVMWRGRNDADFGIEHKGERDLVTTVDKEAQKVIIETIQKAFPTDGFLAEEEDHQNTTEYFNPTWVIDPIDGTTNFVHGLPHCAASIGLSLNGELALGVVYAPFIDTIFVAVRDKGAYTQEGKISVSKTKKLNQALVATGFPYDREDVAPLRDRVELLLKNCADMRRFGAASLDLCYVAMGIVDAYTESVAPWDMAAGLLIATEAGADYCNINLERNPIEFLNSTNLLVATPGILPDLENLLKTI